MGNCEICNKSVHEKSLILIDDKFICLNCDDNHEKTFNYLYNEKLNLLDNIEKTYYKNLGGNFGVHVVFLKNKTLFFYNDIMELSNLFIMHRKITVKESDNLIENELIFNENYPFISEHNIRNFNFQQLNEVK